MGGLINRSYCRVDALYLRFMRGIPYRLESPLSLQLFSIFWNILQDASVLNHFSFYYYNALNIPFFELAQKINNYDIELENIIDEMLGMMKKNDLRRVNNGTHWIYQLLDHLSHSGLAVFNKGFKKKIKLEVDDLLQGRYLKMYN